MAAHGILCIECLCRICTSTCIYVHIDIRVYEEFNTGIHWYSSPYYHISCRWGRGEEKIQQMVYVLWNCSEDYLLLSILCILHTHTQRGISSRKQQNWRAGGHRRSRTSKILKQTFHKVPVLYDFHRGSWFRGYFLWIILVSKLNVVL